MTFISLAESPDFESIKEFVKDKDKPFITELMVLSFQCVLYDCET